MNYKNGKGVFTNKQDIFCEINVIFYVETFDKDTFKWLINRQRLKTRSKLFLDAA